MKKLKNEMKRKKNLKKKIEENEKKMEIIRESKKSKKTFKSK